jgi:hypothetical protein
LRAHHYLVKAALLAAVGGLVGSKIPRPVRRDPSDPPDPVARSLDDRFAQVKARCWYKDHLLDELLAGRTSLKDVADEYLRVDEEDPVVMEVTMRKYAGGSDREKSARHVLDAVRERLPAGVKGRAALDRLRTEFATTFRKQPVRRT